LAEVEALAAEAGWRVRRLSAAGPEPWDVGLVDTFGQLPRYYGLASAVFIGGSLVPHGGQNPLEATSLGKPVAFGPHMHNFQAIAHELLGHHAAVLVAGPPELAGLLARLLDDPAAAAALGARGQEITERFQGATQRTIDALRPFLQPARSA
jgi:3-deoxy-D-manno-octulosonic-acid transferase